VGGRWLAEGADGCVFSAPHNWPCESPAALPAYDPEDPSLVTKIVATDDFEENLFKLFPLIRKKYKLHNLPEFLGTCKPRTTRFVKRTNRTVNMIEYFKNLNRQGKTRKGCKAWARNFEAGRPRKMYVYRKYLVTFADYKKQIADLRLSGPRMNAMAALLAKQATLFHRTLSVLATGTPYQILHYDMHSKNIVLYPVGSKPFDPLDGSTFEIGPADFGRAIWRDTREPLRPDSWDVPYYVQFLSRSPSSRYSGFSQFSLENRLFAYIASHLHEKVEGKTWLELWAADPDVSAERKKAPDPLYWALPTLLSVFPRSPKWRHFEQNLERLVRLLVAAPNNYQRSVALQRSVPLRRFFDKLKGRSMLPVAFGVFLRGALECCGLSLKEREQAMSDKSSDSYALIPNALHPAFQLYWKGLLTILS
jgi:hypothetical protein